MDETELAELAERWRKLGMNKEKRMPASELIKLLEKAIRDHGDYPVRSADYDWLSRVDFVEEEKFAGPCFELSWSRWSDAS